MGDGLGRAPAKPLRPGGDDKARPVASFNKTPTPFGLSCLTAIFANTSLDSCEFFCVPNWLPDPIISTLSSIKGSNFFFCKEFLDLDIAAFANAFALSEASDP